MRKEPKTTSSTLGPGGGLFGDFVGTLELVPFSMAMSCAIEVSEGSYWNSVARSHAGDAGDAGRMMSEVWGRS